VGITDRPTAYLAQAKNVRKCSRRDFPIVLAKRRTVRPPCRNDDRRHMAGIRVFATGGIGGVHRGHPFDVSADLLELAQTPVLPWSCARQGILDLR
jgi:pseudouridine-5'-phosphate glycosidase